MRPCGSTCNSCSCLYTVTCRTSLCGVPRCPANWPPTPRCRSPSPASRMKATSRRMGEMGYRNRNQAAVNVSVNSLRDYLRDLMQAVHTPHPPFAALGVKVDGEHRQLNANILQIENEYYSSMRPKRTPRSGELTGHALARGGVEYVEMRSLDLDSISPESVSTPQLDFPEAFLVL